jgi:serine/threonine-protein kinase
MIGSSFGPYRVLASLGEGGMGAVWKARDTVRDQIVALKLLPEPLAFAPRSRQRFMREARAMAALDHPGVVRIYDLGEIEGRLFISMECVPGINLSERVARGALPVRQAMRVAILAGEALAHAHAHDVIHRDVTGRNIMLAPGGRVVVLDFGLAVAAGASRFTTTGATVGTLHYLAPEVALGGKGDRRADVYGLGVVLYEMLTGRLPFVTERPEAVLYATVNQLAQPPSIVRARVPQDLDRIVLRSLAKQPELRYPGAAEMVAELRALCVRLGRPARARPGRGAMGAHAPLVRERHVPAGAGPGQYGARGARAQGTALSPLPLPIRLAVLAFDDPGLGRDSRAERQDVAGGLAEAVSVRLAQHPGVQIIPPSAAGPAGASVADDGWRVASLGANVALCGTVERRGRSSVRVSYRVLDARRGTLLGSGTVDGRRGDFRAVEDGLVEAVNRLLALPGNGASAGTGEGQRDVAAYEHFLQALGYLQRYESEPALDAAIALLERLRESTLPAARIHAALGRACLYKYKLTSKPDWEKRAVAECERAVQLDPQLPDALVTLGYIHSATGRHEQAARELERALERQPRHPDALLGLAAAYEAAGALPAAEEACARAIALRPDYWGGHSRLGYLCFVQGRYGCAIEHWKRVVRLTPDNARGYYNLGAAYFQSGRYSAARSAYQRSLEIQPGATAYTGLGTVYFYMRRYGEAAAMFERGTALRPDHALNWVNLGDAYRWSRGRESEAAAAYDRAIALARDHLRLSPGDMRIKTCLAMALAKRGHPLEAVREIEAALAAAPGDVRCMEAAGTVYCVVGEHTRAIEWLERAVGGGLAPRNLERDPELAPLRERPRFQAMIQQASGAAAKRAPRGETTGG